MRGGHAKDQGDGAILSPGDTRSSTGIGPGQQDAEVAPALSRRLDQMKSRDHLRTQLFHGHSESHVGWGCYFSCIILIFRVLRSKRSPPNCVWVFLSPQSKAVVSLQLGGHGRKHVVLCMVIGGGRHTPARRYTDRFSVCLRRESKDL